MKKGVVGFAARCLDDEREFTFNRRQGGLRRGVDGRLDDLGGPSAIAELYLGVG